jgi:GT2 family glycosyltransferase
MDLSVVIVSYNSARFLDVCIQSIHARSGGIELEVIVVDNASRDGSADIVAQLFPHVVCIRNSQNTGFAYACNQGIREARGEFVLLLNPDSAIIAGTLEEAVRHMQSHPDIGILGAKILNRNGTLQLACRRSIPTMRSAFFKFSGLSRLFPGSRFFSEYNMTYMDENEPADVVAISGAFLMIQRDLALNVGGLDERFFMYGEDLDLCLRARQAGSRALYWPFIVVRHYKGESNRYRPFASLFHFYHAMWLFYRKHYYEAHAWWENMATWLGICAVGSVRLGLRALLYPLKRRPRE